MVIYRSVKKAAVNASRLKFKWSMVEFLDVYGNVLRVCHRIISLIIPATMILGDRQR